MAENFYGITNTGRMRQNNEDAFLAEKLSNGWILACVIDGVGGYEGGEVAAEIARKTISERWHQPATDPVLALQQTVLQANQNIYSEKLRLQDKEQMACVVTVAVVDIENNQFYYAHVGDTRLYLLRDQSLVKVTKDHSFVGFLEDSGRLTEQEAMAHPKRNEINRALGFDPQLDLRTDYIETGSSPFLPGDMLLLCSDGLSDLVTRSEITTVLLSSTTLHEKGEALIDAANIAGGKDNITVVMVHNNKKPLKIKATKPVLIKKNATEQAAIKPMVAAPVDSPAPKKALPAKRRSNVAVWVLAVLCFVLAGACWYLWTQQPGTTAVKDGRENDLAALDPYQPGQQERWLQDSISTASGLFTVADTAANSFVVIGDTILVRQDTLHINGNGLVLQADSAYRGPALAATAPNQVLVLENITFRNFATAVRWQGKTLRLQKVRFENCGVPVQQYHYLPADSLLSGTVSHSFRPVQNSLRNPLQQ